MSPRILLGLLTVLSIVSLAKASVGGGVLFASLNKTLVVTAQIDGQPIAADMSSNLKWRTGNLTVTWKLNDTFAGMDANYKQVWIKLCYGQISAVDRAWRKNNADLKLSKTCKYSIKRQNYTAEGSTVTYHAPDTIPDAYYFVRAFVLNTTDTTASTGAAAIAFGQTTDANRTKNLFHVEAFTGRNTGIIIATVALSVASYALLIGYFLVERAMKKTS